MAFTIKRSQLKYIRIAKKVTGFLYLECFYYLIGSAQVQACVICWEQKRPFAASLWLYAEIS